MSTGGWVGADRRRRPGPRLIPGRGSSSDSGQSTVELALALPLVMLMALLLVQVALVVRDVVLVEHAAREAARAAVVSREPQAPSRAAGHAGPLAASRLHVEVARLGGEDRLVAAHVTYRCLTEVPIVGWLVPDLTLEATTVMRDEES